MKRHLTLVPPLDGDIGQPLREIELEPISEPGVADPIRTPAPAEPVREPDPVPA